MEARLIMELVGAVVCVFGGGYGGYKLGGKAKAAAYAELAAAQAAGVALKLRAQAAESRLAEQAQAAAKKL